MLVDKCVKSKLAELLLRSPAAYCRDRIFNKHKINQNEKIVIDFSSPNIAKPFHFGHLKSTILGNYLANINTFLGIQVIKLNYIGDWGTQYGLLSLGIDEFGDGTSLETSNATQSPLRYLLDVYVKANERGRSDEAFYSEAKKRFLALNNETDTVQFNKWRKIRDLSIRELQHSYETLGIEFDVFDYESDYAKSSIELVEQMKAQGIARQRDDDVWVTDVEKNSRSLETPLLKSDGSGLYLTRDISAALNRKSKFNYDKMLYVVGADQEKHFHSLKSIVNKMGFDWSEQLVHVKMGKVLNMSSRSGSFLLLSDIIDEATKQYVESTKRVPTSKVSLDYEIDEVGRQLALSALFVFDMRNPRTKHYQFNWLYVMGPSSRSGIHLQTTYARLCSLLDRASRANLVPVESFEDLDPEAISCEEASNLLNHLNELDAFLYDSYLSMDPCPLVNHALKLCRAINRARRSENLWVLGEQDERSARTRLSLFNCSHQQLELIIRLIGLKPLSRV